MDWSKVKTILIFVFIFFNIFLYCIISRFNIDIKVTDKVIENAKSILRNDGVNVKCKIPSLATDNSKYSIEDFTFDREFIKFELFKNERITYEDEKKIVSSNMELNLLNNSNIHFSSKKHKQLESDFAEMEKYIKIINLKGKSFKFDYLQDNDSSKKYIYREYDENKVYYDNFIEFEISENKIEFSTSIKNFIYSKTENKAILPVHIVLLKNFGIDNKKNIIKIDMGIKILKINSDDGAVYDSPVVVWRVFCDDNSEYFFIASNGSKIK